MPRKKSQKKNISNEKNPGKPVKFRAKKTKRFSRVRGMKDVLFDEYRFWELTINKAKDLAQAYGFKGLSTPVLEFSELYERSTGKTSDIVSKEMYSFMDKNGEKISLRPEATPGLARAYIEHGMFNLPQPIKTFWFGPLFRHDRPQAGRTRQHSQINFDILGSESPVADFLLILIAYNFFRELQIDIQVQINSIGCFECRQEYLDKLVEFYKQRGRRSKMCNDCKKRLVKNPLRILDCKEESCVAIREEAPQMVDYLCDSCKNHFIKVLEYLDELNVSYNLNPYLVRGLDYYNRTVFEFWPTEDQGEPSGQLSLGGGGRYDYLIEQMGGRETPACGFGIGVERVVAKIKEKNIPLEENNEKLIFVTQLGDQARVKALLFFEEMRRSGYNVKQAFTKDSLKAQLEEANRLGAKITVIIGQKEVMDNTILIRDMESGIQEVVDYKKVRAEIDKRLKNGD